LTKEGKLSYHNNRTVCKTYSKRCKLGFLSTDLELGYILKLNRRVDGKEESQLDATIIVY